MNFQRFLILVLFAGILFSCSPAPAGNKTKKRESAQHVQKKAKQKNSHNKKTVNSNSVSHSWSESEIATANTAKNADYLTCNEKEVILLLNLCRLDGDKFYELEVKPLSSSDNKWLKSLRKDLHKIKNLPMLKSDRKLFEGARFHAKDSGKHGLVGHDSSDGTSFSSRFTRFNGNVGGGENCYYGGDDPAEIVVGLLVDEGVPSLGHRKNILNRDFTSVGVSIQPHSTYRHNCVQDFKMGASVHHMSHSIVEPVLNHVEIPTTKESCKSQLISHFAYTVDYNPDWYIPNWVAYVLTREHTTGNYKRLNSFSPDPNISDPVLHEDYTNNSGKYDRGHMAPAADMKWSSQAMSESFYTSNICPQNSNLNREDWNDIEELVRDYARTYDSIYVVCGPIVDAEHQTMGRYHEIAIPSAFFKAIARKSGGDWYALGFICSNTSGSKPIMTYTVSIDEIESRTGHDLFSALPDNIEAKMEGAVNLENWSLSR